MTTTTTKKDIVSLLQADHEAAKALLARFDGLAPADREAYFCEVVHELVRHEVAEEMVVYPLIRKDAPDGAREVEPRLEEQAQAEEELAKLEKLDSTSPEFAAKFEKLRSAVLEHASAEEQHIFPLLKALERPDVRQELGGRYETAKSMAPTHPHPHAPDTPPGNVILGPIAAVFDRVRDALKGV
jgi:hemerythrin superfamily protein